MARVMLTTKDNPYDPFEQFDDWYNWDEMAGYHTCGYLGRVAGTSMELSDEENDSLVEEAIDNIVRLDPLEMYVKVTRDEKSQKQAEN